MGQPLNIWDKIQLGVSETERLIGQRDYNKAMVQARQTLEVMVKALGNKACIVESDLASTIDQLYEGRWIDKITRDHYHRIRMIGNKAAHEGHNSSADANLVFTLLSQEADAFSEYKAEHRNNRTIAYIPLESGRSGSGNRSSSGSRPSGSRNTARSSSARSNTARNSSGARSVNRRPSGKKKKRKRGITLRDLLPLLAVLAGIILLVVLIRVFMPDKEDNAETTAPTSSVQITETEPLPTEPETTPQVVETTPAAPPETATYKTNSTLNVRYEPSTSARIAVQLAPGTEVNYVGVHDDFWSIINYEGTDVYVATQYLTQE